MRVIRVGNLWGVAFAVLLLAANAFFVAAEFALISARRDRLEALRDQGKKRAKAVIDASENLSLMLAGCQLGITIASILLGRVGEPAIAHLLEVPLEWVHLPHQFLHPISFVIALSLVVMLHILLGEMVPKNIALAGPETAALLLVPVHLMFIRVVRPVIWLYNLMANSLLRACGIEPKDELDSAVSTPELTLMIGESHSVGYLDEEEHSRLTRALRTSARPVLDVLIPMAQVRSLQVTIDPVTGQVGPTLGSLEDAVRETGFSRYPIRDGAGPLTGYLHLKDVLTEIADENVAELSIIGAQRIRPLPQLASTLTLEQATTQLREHSAHLAAVTDANGTTLGLVALEDLVEEFVGTVRDGTHRSGM